MKWATHNSGLVFRSPLCGFISLCGLAGYYCYRRKRHSTSLTQLCDCEVRNFRKAADRISNSSNLLMKQIAWIRGPGEERSGLYFGSGIISVCKRFDRQYWCLNSPQNGWFWDLPQKAKCHLLSSPMLSSGFDNYHYWRFLVSIPCPGNSHVMFCGANGNYT